MRMETQITTNGHGKPPFRRILLPGKRTVEFTQSPVKAPSRLACPSQEGYRFIQVSGIRYCQAEGNYTRIYIADGSSLLISRTLSCVEEALPGSVFIRIHQSFLANREMITHFHRDHVVINDAERLPVSRNRKKETGDRLLDNMILL